MAAGNGTKTGVGQEILDLLDRWYARAQALGAVDGNHFVLSGETGAFRVSMDASDVGARLFWSSLTTYPSVVDVHTDRLNDADDKSFPPLNEDASQAMLDMLQPGVVEVAPLVHVLYGFVADDRIVAVSFTTDVYKSSLTKRSDLGLNEDTFVADAAVFKQLSPVQLDLAAWYTHFWTLQQQGNVVRLSDRVRGMSGIWSRKEGDIAWIEFDDTDGQLPAFIAEQAYVSWLITSNEPSLHERNGESSQRHALDGWFQ